MNHMSFLRNGLVALFVAQGFALMGIRACFSAEQASLAPPRHGKVYVVAHRGSHVGIPENTLAAYRKAIEIGVDFIEIDLRVTKDRQLVSIHDSEIDGYALNGRTGRVADLSLAELKQLDIGSRVGSQWKDERIPTFEEILQLCKGRVGIYLHLKDAPVELAVDRVKQSGMAGQILWFADAARLEQVKKLCPECVIMPDPGAEANLPQIIERFHPRFVAAVWRNFSEGFAQTCHQAGVIVIVDEWGKSVWPKATQWGADGIQTDFPAELIEYLESRSR
jgi:glycerophosphoryl diester phosphodiesterase